MDSKISAQLEQAKAYFYALRLVEAYNILRRYFDRLPFQPEPEHAEYIGIFARTMAELGKENDLNFYLAELERLHEKMRSAAIAYQLAVVYSYLPEPRYEASRRLLEDIIRDPAAKGFHAKAKMMLAVYYDSVQNNVAACRQLIDSIGEVSDTQLKPLLTVWKAKILRDEGTYLEAERMLLAVIKEYTADTNWYAFFSAKVILANLYLVSGRREDSTAIVKEVRQLFAGKNFKSVAIQVAVLEKNIAQAEAGAPLVCHLSEGGGKVCYSTKALPLNPALPPDRLLIQLIRRGYLDKAVIVKNLFSRAYESGSDDKLIYYHMHNIRKRLKGLGLKGDAVVAEDSGYRLVPEVKIVEEEL